MANHSARGAQSQPAEPEVKWVTLVQTPEGWRPAVLTTRGYRGAELLGVPERDKRYAEDAFRLAAVDHVLGWST